MSARVRGGTMREDGTMPTALFAHPGAELFGSDRMLIESVAASVDAGFRTVVALPAKGALVDELLAVGAEVVIVPMLVLRKALLRPRGWPTLVKDALRGWVGARRLLRSVRPDAVYVNTITIPQWTVASRLRRTHTITHVHEAEASASRMINIGLYLPHVAASSVIVNSEFSRATIARALPALARRSRVVYNGVVGPSDPHLPRESIDGALRVLYLGRLSPRKGPDVLVEAARMLTESGVPVRADLVGAVFDGYEWFEEELRQRIADAGLADSVRLHGFQSPIWPYLADADVLVVPSRIDEPFGNTAVEGVLALRPVVASDTSGLREATGGHPTTFLVPPADARALADALESVREQWPTVRGQLRESARRADERHSVATYRQDIAEELRAALA